jgi:hypothetical protein
VHRSQFEPKLLDMLADPVTQAVIDADRVDVRELIAMLSEIGHALKRPRGTAVGSRSSASGSAAPQPMMRRLP